MNPAQTQHSPSGNKTTAPALTLDSVSKNFGGLHVLSSVSFTVPEATIFGIAGPNGAGKTTLLNLLTGFGDASSGRVRVHGQDSSSKDAHQISAMGVARTFQNIRLFRGLTVREQVEAGFYRRRQASLLSSVVMSPTDRFDRMQARATADELLEFVGIAKHANRLAETMSYGDQRRIEVARALATGPSILMLDEPTAGMNAADWQPIADLLTRLRGDGMTVIVVEHNMRLLESVCDRVVVIAAGEVIAEDEPFTCLRSPDVRRAYFGK